MSNNKSTLVSRYDITKIASPILSYYQKLVPADPEERVKFINAIVLNAPYLVGLAKRYAALMSGAVDYDKLKKDFSEEGFSNVVSSKLKDILDSEALNYADIQNEIFFNLYYYPEVAATILPIYDYWTTCPDKHKCGRKIMLSEPIGRHFEYTLEVPVYSVARKDSTKNTFKMSGLCPYCGTRIQKRTVKTSEKKATLEEPNIFVKIWNPYYTSVERGAYRGRTSVYINPSRFRECYPSRYANGSKYTFSDLDNIDPNLLYCYMVDMPYNPNPKFTKVFINKPSIAGLEDGLSPVLLALVALLHTGSLRRGQEADAIIKSSPHMMLTPVSGENSTISTTLDAGKVTELIMQMVREVEQGDTTGMMYFPTPVKADKLFADPRRTMLEREIKEEEMGTMITTGLDASIFSGGTGLPNDPFILHVMNELLSGGTSQMQAFSKMIVKQMKQVMNNVIILPAGLKDLPVIRIDRAPGTLVDSEYKELAKNKAVPFSPWISKFGYESAAEAQEAVAAETFEFNKIEKEFQTKLEEYNRTDELLQAAKGVISQDVIAQVEALIGQQAEEIAQKMQSMPAGKKRSYMHQIQTENLLLYGMVKVKLQVLNNALERDAKAFLQQGGEGGEEQF